MRMRGGTAIGIGCTTSSARTLLGEQTMGSSAKEPTTVIVAHGTAGALQIAANVAVISACVCVSLVAVRVARDAPALPASTYAVGEKIDSVDGVKFQGSQRTLLMVLRQDCRYCHESVPFYQRLTAALRARNRQDLRVVVVSTDTSTLMSAYLRASDIAADDVVHIEPGALKVPGTPFLFLVNDHGIVERVWRGKLGAAQEQEVLHVLASN